MPFIQKSVAVADLAPDLPNAATAASQHPEGAVYASESTDAKFRGKRYKLRHARWVPVVIRERAKNGEPASKKK